MPKVSICVPCFNNPGDVERLLNSIGEQSFTDYEVILSDDSTDRRIEEMVKAAASSSLISSLSARSAIEEMVKAATASGAQTYTGGSKPEAKISVTDAVITAKESKTTGTAAIASTISAGSPRSVHVRNLHYTHNPSPLGVVLNWNAAIRQASGEYIKIMFSDDWFTTGDSLAEFVRMLDEHPNADLAFSGSRQCRVDVAPDQNAGTEHMDGRQDYDRHASDEFIRDLQQDFRTLFCTNQIGAPSATIYRRIPVNAICSSGQVFDGSDSTSNKAIDASGGQAIPSSAGPGVPLFDEKSGFASDVFLYMSILSHNPAFACTKAPLVCIGLHEKQYTETFSENDPGKYKDYRLLFLQYQLWQKEQYQAFFLREYLLPYRKGIAESRALHIPDALYRKERRAWQKKVVKSFLHARLHSKG